MKSIPLPSSIIQCVSTPRKCGVYRGELKNHQHTITIPARVMEDMPRASKGSRVEWEVIDPYTILLTLPGARAQENSRGVKWNQQRVPAGTLYRGAAPP